MSIKNEGDHSSEIVSDEIETLFDLAPIMNSQQAAYQRLNDLASLVRGGVANPNLFQEVQDESARLSLYWREKYTDISASIKRHNLDWRLTNYAGGVQKVALSLGRKGYIFVTNNPIQDRGEWNRAEVEISDTTSHVILRFQCLDLSKASEYLDLRKRYTFYTGNEAQKYELEFEEGLVHQILSKAVRTFEYLKVKGSRNDVPNQRSGFDIRAEIPIEGVFIPEEIAQAFRS